MQKNSVVREAFATSDLVLICNTEGEILFYEGFDDEIVSFPKQKPNCLTIFNIYPFFASNEFTVLKAIREKRPIINELQIFTYRGKTRRCLNTAYPLMHQDTVVGGLVLSLDLDKATYPTKHNFEDIITEDPVFLRRLEALKVFARNDSREPLNNSLCPVPAQCISRYLHLVKVI